MPLVALDDHLHVAESSLSVPGAPLPLRATLVRCRDGSVIIHSPIAFSDDDISRIDALGAVVCIVAPNGFHHLFVGRAQAQWPNAAVWASQAIGPKAPSLRISNWFGKAPWPYDSDLQAFPLIGAPKIAETVFYHPETKSLVVTDLVFNLLNPEGFVASLVYRMFGTYKELNSSRLYRHFIADKSAFAASLEPVLALPFRRVIMAHGDVLSGDDLPARLRQATRRLCT